MLNKIGTALVVLNLVMAIGSGLFFLFVEGLGPVSWLVVNTCALGVLFFVDRRSSKITYLLLTEIRWYVAKNYV